MWFRKKEEPVKAKSEARLHMESFKVGDKVLFDGRPATVSYNNVREWDRAAMLSTRSYVPVTPLQIAVLYWTNNGEAKEMSLSPNECLIFLKKGDNHES